MAASLIEQSPSAGSLFLKCSVETLQGKTAQIHDCFRKLDEETIWRRQSTGENAIGNLVMHLSGNVRQWIGSFVGGLEDKRERPGEFAQHARLESAALLARLDETIQLARRILESLSAERLTETIPVQNGKSATVLEAIYHVVGHFEEHTGQIIFATKLWTGEELGGS